MLWGLDEISGAGPQHMLSAGHFAILASNKHLLWWREETGSREGGQPSTYSSTERHLSHPLPKVAQAFWFGPSTSSHRVSVSGLHEILFTLQGHVHLMALPWERLVWLPAPSSVFWPSLSSTMGFLRKLAFLRYREENRFCTQGCCHLSIEGKAMINKHLLSVGWGGDYGVCIEGGAGFKSGRGPF